MLAIVTLRSTDASFASISIRFTLKRLGFYIALLTFRGWVLYVYLNKLEDEFVVSKVNNSTSTATSCWYNDGWLQVGQETCVGRSFDFSDHVVFYYAQLLPIALIETAYAFQQPYWRIQGNTTICGRIAQTLIPIVLSVSHVYLQLITAMGAFRTAAFFHTPGEVIAGFMVSLVVAAPLCILQCGNRHWVALLRSFLFP
jgi:hypothetical protein